MSARRGRGSEKERLQRLQKKEKNKAHVGLKLSALLPFGFFFVAFHSVSRLALGAECVQQLASAFFRCPGIMWSRGGGDR